MGVQWAGASSIMTALNFLVTIVTMRAPGMTFWRMPLLVWANFSTSTLVVLATPFIAGSQFFVMFDRVMHMSFFEVAGGGYVLGYQHIFWFYSHPAVYIMMLPGFGIVSEIVAVMSRKPIFGYRLMALSLLAILVLGFSVWAHHMFVAGMADWLRVPMMVTTLLIAVPTGIKIFSWCATIWGGKIHFTTPMLFAVGLHRDVHDRRPLGHLPRLGADRHPRLGHVLHRRAHPLRALRRVDADRSSPGIYYWFPKMTGRMYNEKLGKLHFWLTFIGFNVTFFPMHYIGLQGMPRRVADYADRFGDFNLVISIASFGLGASTLVFLYNMIWSWKYGPRGRGEPVARAHARVAGQLAAADLQLRRDPAGRRRPVRVRRPERAPRDLRRREARTGGRLNERRTSRRCRTLPGARPRRTRTQHPPPIHYSSRISPLIVGIFLFIGSEIMLFGSFFTVYFFYRVVNPQTTQWPPEGFIRPWYIALINTCILVTSSFTVHWATTSIKRGNRTGLQCGLALTFLLGLTFLLTQVVEYHRIGFNTSDGAFPSTFFGLTGLHGFHVFVGLMILLVMTIRVVPGALQPGAPSRRRGRRNLLALRRRNVDCGVRHGVHPLTG